MSQRHVVFLLGSLGSFENVVDHGTLLMVLNFFFLILLRRIFRLLVGPGLILFSGLIVGLGLRLLGFVDFDFLIINVDFDSGR